MQILSRLLEAAMAVVFVFGLLGSLISGSRMSSRPLARRAVADAKDRARVSGFGGTMGWDGFDQPASPGGSQRRQSRAQ